MFVRVDRLRCVLGSVVYAALDGRGDGDNNYFGEIDKGVILVAAPDEGALIFSGEC